MTLGLAGVSTLRECNHGKKNLKMFITICESNESVNKLFPGVRNIMPTC